MSNPNEQKKFSSQPGPKNGGGNPSASSSAAVSASEPTPLGTAVVQPAAPQPAPSPAQSAAAAEPIYMAEPLAAFAPESVAVVLPKPEDVERKPYWIGLMKDCPIDTAGVAGVTFQKATFAPGRNAQGVQEASLRNDGGIVHLSESEKRDILARMSTRGVRVSNAGRRAELTLLEFDTVPLAYFAWMVRVDPKMRILADMHTLPQTMAARPAGAKIPALRMTSVTAEARTSVGVQTMALDDDGEPARGGYSDTATTFAPTLGAGAGGKE